MSKKLAVSWGEFHQRSNELNLDRYDISYSLANLEIEELAAKGFSDEDIANIADAPVESVGEMFSLNRRIRAELLGLVRRSYKEGAGSDMIHHSPFCGRSLGLRDSGICRAARNNRRG